MRQFSSVFALVLIVARCSIGYAANSVVVESKSVAPYSSVTIGVYLTNDVTLETVNIPLEIRTATGGAFRANTLSAMVDPGGRVVQYFTFNSVLLGATKSGGCFSNGAPDFVSPDAVRFQSGSGTQMPAESDGSPGSGTPSYTISRGPNCDEGTFIIDTVCFNSQHLFFDPSPGSPFAPTFTPATITIDPALQACTCNDRPTDTDCNGYTDVIDVTRAKNVAFNNYPEYPACCNGALGGGIPK